MIPRGVIHGTRYNIGDKIRYSCVMGYVLEGHAVLTCIVSPGSGASWDFPAPFCRGKMLYSYIDRWVKTHGFRIHGILWLLYVCKSTLSALGLGIEFDTF